MSEALESLHTKTPRLPRYQTNRQALQCLYLAQARFLGSNDLPREGLQLGYGVVHCQWWLPTTVLRDLHVPVQIQHLPAKLQSQELK